MWIPVSNADQRALGIYLRHYSARKNGATQRGAKNWNRFTSPGESMTLLTPLCDALFIWIKQKYRLDRQVGVNCAVFRNEGTVLSSDLIREASDMAEARWPDERLYTYVNPRRIRSTNPGCCFLKAGWRVCGESKGGLIILEKVR